MIFGKDKVDVSGSIRASGMKSIFGRLFKLSDATLVYPAHDYKGDAVSTIGEERAYRT